MVFIFNWEVSVIILGWKLLFGGVNYFIFCFVVDVIILFVFLSCWLIWLVDKVVILGWE